MERSTIVHVREGLHARPATRFVKLAKSFACDVEILKASTRANAKSSVKLMLLAVKENDEITLRAEGPDAPNALDALVQFLQNPAAGLGDEAEAHVTALQLELSAPALPADGAVHGVAASEGVALAPIFPYFPRQFAATGRMLRGGEIEAEHARFDMARQAVGKAMREALDHTEPTSTDHSIISALREIAADPAITDSITAEIEKGRDALDAVLDVTEATAVSFSRVPDVYLNARADDVRAIGRQICFALAGESDVGLDQISTPSIVLAEDIGAWDLARAPLKLIAGILCARGGATSHIAIMARAHGIPAVLGLGASTAEVRTARDVAIDGGSGVVYLDPGLEIRKHIEARIRAASAEEQTLKAFKDSRPRRDDSTLVEIAANIGSIEEIEAAKEAGAMGVGLFRTELLFMKHATLPSEDAQFAIYAEAAKAFAPDPVIIRTLDIGGDKAISGIAFPEEENPFLGWRGVRMCLDRLDVFKPQLRALLRAAAHGNIKVMLPMVSTVDEVLRVRAIIEDCKSELRGEERAFGTFALGIMIETPAAVLIASELAKVADFFSIGTNDLTQYVMAADRMNPNVSTLNDVANPAVLAAIEMTARAGVAAGIQVGMCGEAAARPDLIPKFLDMGLTELSMSPASIPRAKRCVMSHYQQDGWAV